MNRYLKIVLYGFVLWLIPFVVSALIFPLRASDRPLFESIMPVVIVIWTVFFSIIYLLSQNLSVKKGCYLREGFLIGLAWLAMSIVFDLMIFIIGPLKMSLMDYTTDIAFTYLMIPAITSGYGYLLDRSVA
ncbi:MAG TPA: hypothetical protein PLZ44_04590 [Methanothrix sp.]|nr:hypothetical protein [Methanothrix sp.]